jgi:protein-S-isoprenylcysteine O-methyltransferase Ste14
LTSATPNHQNVSAAEQTPAARIGAVLFKNRGWLPVPFLVVPVLAMQELTTRNLIIGAIVMVIGEWWRMWGVATAGTVTRRRSRNVQKLVSHGPFAWSRNPLYNGNFLLWIGIITISGVYWFLPVATVIFAVEYYYIVRYEEGVLESIFGQVYLDYKAKTPRWFPRPPKPEDAEGEFFWAEAWRSEISTFMQFVAIIAIFWAKDRFM